MDTIPDTGKNLPDHTAIALINLNISNIKSDVSDIKVYIKELSLIFASKEQLLEVARDAEKRIVKLEESSQFWKIASPTISAVLSSFITFLTIQYLAHVK